MGTYINPRGISKEDWLSQNGMWLLLLEVYHITFDSAAARGQTLVCLVNNGAFSAAAIMTSEAERLTWLDSEDTRPKDWYLVETSLLSSVTQPRYPQ